MARVLLLALALVGSGRLVFAEIVLLSNGLTLKLDGHRVEDGALVYEHLQTSLCLGPVRIPCPRFLGPRIEAREWQEDGFDGVCASIVAKTAGGRVIVSYTGRLQAGEGAA